MHGLSKKLLTIFLSLLLSLVPLQGVFASFSGVCDHDMEMGQLVDKQADSVTLTASQESHSCKHCSALADCNSHQCSSIHYVLAELHPDTYIYVKSVASPALPSVRDSAISQVPPLLFRPPRPRH